MVWVGILRLSRSVVVLRLTMRRVECGGVCGGIGFGYRQTRRRGESAARVVLRD
nr:MAG TPA: hypothetical protein [Caudoviricetes sp.]